MNGTQVMIAILGGMLLLEIVLTIWHGRYLAKTFRKIDADDAALFLQGRDTNSIAREMRELLQRNSGG